MGNLPESNSESESAFAASQNGLSSDVTSAEKPKPLASPHQSDNGSPDNLKLSRKLPAVWQRRQRMSIWLFVLTCASTYAVGDWHYCLAIMTTLLAHEMGHYLQSVRYKVPATYPFFIPMPFSPLGTMGAVIVQDSRSADRRAMFDIAVSGPLAGLVIALPVLIVGIAQATYEPYVPNSNSLVFGDPLILTWIAMWFHGPEVPGTILMLDSLGFAGWVGILFTSLNLLPLGQLDGGHILYTLIGKRAHTVAYTVLAGGIGYMAWTQYPAYLLLLVLVAIMGVRHPPTANDDVPLGITRHIIGWATLAFLFVGFTPQPIIIPDPPDKPSTPAVVNSQPD